MNRTERRQAYQSNAARQATAQRRRIVAIGSLVVLAAVVIIAISLASRVPKTASDAPISATLAVGQKAPDFSVSTTNGPFELSKSLSKPTLLEVFATWCPHCQRETAVLNKIAATYRGRANVVAVSGSPYGLDQTQPESQADVVAFMTKYGVTYPIAFDPNLDVAHKYLQGGFPTIVLIDTGGIVRGIRDGEIPHADLVKALDASVAGRKPDPGLKS